MSIEASVMQIALATVVQGAVAYGFGVALRLCRRLIRRCKAQIGNRHE
ncbi:MAG TPA: hypothetical protein VN924_01875 [Bryobacteraceae bacterium]|jgi:hypothetical protein|nr:hypothetical protein [Bryobacteraceae bacterium]